MSVGVLRRMEEFEGRLRKLEERGFEDALTLVEILSNVCFFGGIKMEKCGYAKNGQCGLFALDDDARKKIPIATECRIKDCEHGKSHLHLELSNMTCAFCPIVDYTRSLKSP